MFGSLRTKKSWEQLATAAWLSAIRRKCTTWGSFLGGIERFRVLSSLTVYQLPEGLVSVLSNSGCDGSWQTLDAKWPVRTKGIGAACFCRIRIYSVAVTRENKIMNFWNRNLQASLTEKLHTQPLQSQTHPKLGEIAIFFKYMDAQH